MSVCPKGHGEKAGGYCDECGAELTPTAMSTGDKVSIRSPEAHASASVHPTFVLPGGAIETRPSYVKCPQCGRRKPEPETFDCRGDCGRQNLCLDHFDREYEVCVGCADLLRSGARTEAGYLAWLQAELAQWRRRAERAEAQVQELTQPDQQGEEVLCPGCGATQPSDQPFCDDCGARLPGCALF